MVSRTIVVLDSANLVVTSSSSGGLVGNGVINNSSTPDGTIFSYTGGSGQTVTLEDTGGSADVFEDDNAGNHVITDGGGLVANGQNVEAESLITLRALDGNGNPTGPVITITVFSQGGVTGDVWGFSSDLPLEDGTSYTKTGGSNIGSSSYDSFVTCFVKGTVIDTPEGRRPIEDILPGEPVCTREHGALPVRWVGRRSVLGQGRFAPVHIAAGALGNDAALMVSPEHRMVVENLSVELYFGLPQALSAAKHLVGLPGITQPDRGEITYHHLMFDSHQIICGAGCWSESFFLARNALSGLDRAARDEILALFPAMPRAQPTFGSTAYPVLKQHEAALLRSAMTGKSTAFAA